VPLVEQADDLIWRIDDDGKVFENVPAEKADIWSGSSDRSNPARECRWAPVLIDKPDGRVDR
jgi:hypothetical protein